MKCSGLVVNAAILLAVAAVAAAACSADGPTPATVTSPPETAIPEPTATVLAATSTAVAPSPAAAPTPEGFHPPETPLSASLFDSYAVRDGQQIRYATTDLPIVVGSAAAFWYQAMGRYVVLFDGVDLAKTGPICPGASILSTETFEHVSNGPTAEGACEGASVLAEFPAGAYVCDGVLVYVTEIPAGTEGVLYGTLERYVDGTIFGVTSSTHGAASMASEIDLTECRRLP